MENHPDCHIVIGGDFNVDLERDWVNTAALLEFCSISRLHPLAKHSNYNVDCTYHFSMKHLYSVDHFIVSLRLCDDG